VTGQPRGLATRLRRYHDALRESDTALAFLVGLTLPMDLSGKTILITGGTGSFGKACIEALLERHDPRVVRVFSRDELKQSELQAHYLAESRLRFFLGDVRDRDRLVHATRGVDLIIHAAALKQVPACEYNPFEAVQTNVIGAENVVAAAIASQVPRTLLLSTDKAVNPVNLYGATKLCAEKIVTQGNALAADSGVRFASVRYGNVVGSRGSVVPIFLQQAETGRLTVTDERMTRFWITLDQAVDFVLSRLRMMEGGEVFVPKIPSMRVVEIADAIAPDAERMITGIRPGEKLHEVLVTEDESRHARELDDCYVIYPEFPSWREQPYDAGTPVPDGFRYASDTNTDQLSAEGLRVILPAPQAVS
jgi:UDP-N-acetylglucosamine 4,6-dehydratase